MKPSIKIVTRFPGQWYGYCYRFIRNKPRRDEFMQRLKTALPVRAYDGSTFTWWVPDVYALNAEVIGLEFGGLERSDLVSVSGFRVGYMNLENSATLADDMKTLGLQPDAPYQLAEMAAYHWRATLSQQPIGTLEAGLKEAAWLRIKAHFEAQAAVEHQLPQRMPEMP